MILQVDKVSVEIVWIRKDWLAVLSQTYWRKVKVFVQHLFNIVAYTEHEIIVQAKTLSWIRNSSEILCLTNDIDYLFKYE